MTGIFDVGGVKNKKEFSNDYCFKNLQKLHEGMTRNSVWILWMIILIIALGFDFVPWPYVGIFEKIFDYNLDNMVAILVVVWTFATTIIGYWLEKAEERVYAVKVIQLLLYEYGMAKITAFIGIIILELVILIIIAVAEYEITAVFMALFLVYTVIYAFLSFCVIPTKSNACNQIKKEISTLFSAEKQEEAYINGLLDRILRGMRKSEESCEEELLEILKLISDVVKEKFSERSTIRQKREVYLGCRIIIDEILKFKWNAEKNYIVFRNWMNYDEELLEVKQAVIASLLEDALLENYNTLEKLLTTESKQFHELYIWTIIYSLYCKTAKGRRWQCWYIERLKKKFGKRWCVNDERRAIDYWKIINGEDTKNFRPVFDYIWNDERN